MNPIGNHLDAQVPMIWYMVSSAFRPISASASMMTKYSIHWHRWALYEQFKQSGQLEESLKSIWTFAMAEANNTQKWKNNGN